MKSCFPLSITLGVITTFFAVSGHFSWEDVARLALKRTCLEQENVSEDVFPGHDVIEIFETMTRLPPEQVPHGSKCVLRCFLKTALILKDNFIINEELNQPNSYCESLANALANGDQCEFAFIYAQCAPEIINAEIGQTSSKSEMVDWQSQPYEEYEEEEQRIERECLNEENIEDRSNLRNNNAIDRFLSQIQQAPVIPRNAKCFLRCWYKKHGFLRNKFIMSIGPLPELRPLMHECNQVAREWSEKQSNNDECEFAWSFYNCVHETMESCSPK
uniref:Uncharacterized protein n=1 Tax=Glossina brevipalpis TaxID=37001 RepID=A0A1A9WXM1_9MUSC